MKIEIGEDLLDESGAGKHLSRFLHRHARRNDSTDIRLVLRSGGDIWIDGQAQSECGAARLLPLWSEYRRAEIKAGRPAPPVFPPTKLPPGVVLPQDC